MYQTLFIRTKLGITDAKLGITDEKMFVLCMRQGNHTKKLDSDIPRVHAWWHPVFP
jgi:hypothetical protein